MSRIITERLVVSLLVILGSLILVFCILYVLPGDPVLSMIDPSSMTPEAIANLRHQLGLNEPFYVQFGNYFVSILHGDFGKSLLNSEPVLPKIIKHLPATLALMFASTLISTIIGVGLG